MRLRSSEHHSLHVAALANPAVVLCCVVMAFADVLVIRLNMTEHVTRASRREFWFVFLQ